MYTSPSGRLGVWESNERNNFFSKSIIPVLEKLRTWLVNILTTDFLKGEDLEIALIAALVIN